MIILWTGHGAAPRVLLYFLICRSIPHIHKHVKQGLHELAESEAGNFRTAVLNLARTWHDVAAGTRTVHVPFPLRSRSSEIGLMAGDNNKAHYSLWLVPLPGLSRLGFFFFFCRHALVTLVRVVKGCLLLAISSFFFFCWNACITALHLYIYIICCIWQ